MADSSHITKQFEAAERMQSQFRFYFVSLVFTLLAASIQTAKFGSSHVQSIAELTGWLLFSMSGLVALSYLEWEPIVREQLASRDSYAHQLNDAKTAKLRGITELHVLESGQTQSLEERIKNLENATGQLAAAADIKLARAGLKYEVWRWSFVAALAAMLVARGAPAFVDIFGYRLL